MHQAVYQKLKEMARKRETICYGEIAPLAGLPSSGSYMGKKLGEILQEICENEHRQARPLLSAVVVRKNIGVPGEGFFKKARILGAHQGSNDRAFWMQELDNVYKYWSSGSKGK